MNNYLSRGTQVLLQDANRRPQRTSQFFASKACIKTYSILKVELAGSPNRTLWSTSRSDRQIVPGNTPNMHVNMLLKDSICTQTKLYTLKLSPSFKQSTCKVHFHFSLKNYFRVLRPGSSLAPVCILLRNNTKFLFSVSKCL